ncbi:NUDIX hydrolase [Parageobacillus thermoglucosidasius]|uniref:NUDIX hydrolase n=1 Tax=Parageobacillus thermoglucosidasius TaxID=1426 RepID=UPI00025B87EA|nr:NUDIX hydrolase [Parageobacillus thermoglucosidasius]EID45694.1 mutT/nudix family protein [Parageobacillus thermoglucosidasius TNO-09.020]REK59014.1 MAG: NUDIX domain-containing protein [Geobacillus sp.]
MRTRVRAAGVVVHNEHILLHKMDDFWVLPGGGVGFEATTEGLKREFKEELGIEIKIKNLLWVAENFFEYNNQKEQSIEFYYLIEFPENSALYNQNSFEGCEGKQTLKFKWHKIDNINNLTILPEFLAEYLKELRTSIPERIQHIINKTI